MMPLNERPISIEELLTEREWLTRLARRLVADSTLVAFQAGGGAWWHWLHAMKQALLGTQQPTGRRAGSWEPGPGESRIRTTALNVATLTVFYRYPRLFRR